MNHLKLTTRQAHGQVLPKEPHPTWRLVDYIPTGIRCAIWIDDDSTPENDIERVEAFKGWTDKE